MKKITVIIPCHNVADYIDICLDNILNQSIGFENIEVILIDDVSTDNGRTLNVLRDFEKNHDANVILIENQVNMGAGGCRNVALQYASGEYIAYCDADDWFDIHAFELLYNIAKTNDADVIEFGYEKTYEHTGMSRRIEEPIAGEMAVISNLEERRRFILPGDYDIISCNKIYRSELLKTHDIRFSEHAIYEEPPFTYMVRLCADRYFKTNEKLYYYFQHSNSSSKQYYDRISDVHKAYDMFLLDSKMHGVYEDLKEEIDFVYWSGCFLLPILNMAKSGYFYSREQYKNLQKSIAVKIGDIRKNKYLEEYLPNRALLGDLTYIDVDRVDFSDITEYFSELSKG